MVSAAPSLSLILIPEPLSNVVLLSLAVVLLLHWQDDSIEGIFDTLKTCACISKYAGGIGLSIHNIRATKSHIRGTNGSSNGLVPMLKVFSDTARYFTLLPLQGHPWHRRKQTQRIPVSSEFKLMHR
jgi:hypothetical protein